MPADTLQDRHKLQNTLAFLAILAVCVLRALPAFERGTYATEGGEWLARMWQQGFWQMIFGARGDYGVLGNMLVIKGADLLTQLFGGHSLAACGPDVQHVMSCLYVALIFAFIFSVLRTYHGWWHAALVTSVMLLAPDLDGENRIFGEANNVGFFNALGIVFLYYDVWLRDRLSTGRMVAYALMIGVHLLTSPMAGLVALGFCALLIARSAWAWKQRAQPLPAVVWLHVATIALAVWTILQARPEASDPNSEHAAHTAAVVLPRFWKTFVELVLCRQVLYPLTLNVYEHFSDGRTIALLIAVLALVAWWIKTELQASRGQPDLLRLSLLPLLLGIVFCMSVVTLWSRGWLTQTVEPYTKIWPARYYLVQTMLSAGFLSMVVLRLGELFPRFRRDATMLVLVLMGSFVAPQAASLQAALDHRDPGVKAKRWPHQLARVHDRHAHEPLGEGDVVDVEMYIDHHFVAVPAPMMREFFARPQPSRDDLCEAALVDAAAIKPDPKRKLSKITTSELRVIPRPGGTLVTFDLHLDDQAHFSLARRKLWFGGIAGNPEITATSYDLLVPRVQELSKKRLNDLELLLFKVQLWFSSEVTATQLKTLFVNAQVAIGAQPGEALAMGVLTEPGDEAPLSSLPDDDTAANRHQPMDVVFHWAGSTKGLMLHNVLSDTKGGLSMADDAPFDEAAYLRLNPDVAHALSAGAITSGRAHYEHWGRHEPRQIARYSVSLDVSKAGLSTDRIAGLRLEINRRKERPALLCCVLHGPDGKRSEVRLVPSEGEGVFDVFHLPAVYFGSPHPVQRLEIEFEHPQENRAFRLEDVFIYERATQKR